MEMNNIQWQRNYVQLTISNLLVGWSASHVFVLIEQNKHIETHHIEDYIGCAVDTNSVRTLIHK